MNIEHVCEHIAKLTDEDFADVEAEALMQTNYHHSMAPTTSAKVRKIGQHNLKSLKMLKELQDHLQQAIQMENDL